MWLFNFKNIISFDAILCSEWDHTIVATSFRSGTVRSRLHCGGVQSYVRWRSHAHAHKLAVEVQSHSEQSIKSGHWQNSTRLHIQMNSLYCFETSYQIDRCESSLDDTNADCLTVGYVWSTISFGRHPVVFS